jgi:hypothetical protein
MWRPGAGGPDQDSLPFTAIPDILVRRPKWAHRRDGSGAPSPQPGPSTQAARRLQLFKYTAVGPGNPHVRVAIIPVGGPFSLSEQ